MGADCTLQVVPYYNKPSQEGIYRHFKAIAEAVDIPVVLYNVPGRTVADMQTDTVLRLAQVPGIVGIKEATGDIERAAWLIKQAPAGFSIYSGDDGTAVALMLLGGQGNVSVTANVAPKLMHELCMAAIEGDVQACHRHPPAAAAAAQAAVLRAQPGAHQVGHGPAGPVRQPPAPAHPAAHARRRGHRRPGPARQRPAALTATRHQARPQSGPRRRLPQVKRSPVARPDRLPLLALAALCAMLGTACTSTSDGFLAGDKVDYRGPTVKAKPLEVPPDLTQLARDSRYQPQGGVISAAATPGAAPSQLPGSAIPVAPTARGDIRVERQGEMRWLVVPMPPEQLWPLLKTFWQERGFTLASESAETGVMETDWAENRAKLPQDFIRSTHRPHLRRHVRQRRARHVPHARRTHAPPAARSTSATAGWRRSTPTSARRTRAGARGPAIRNWRPSS